MPRIDPSIVRLAFFIGSLTAVFAILILFRSIFLPLLLGLGIAYLLDPSVGWIERRGRSRLFGVAAIGSGLLLLALGIFLYVVPAVVEQVQHQGEKLPEYAGRLQAQWEPWLAHLEGPYAEPLRRLPQELFEGLRGKLPEVTIWFGRQAGAAFSSVLNFLLFLLNLVFVPVFTFYLLVDFPKIRRGIANLIPLAYREETVARVWEVDQALSSFIRGQLTIALILAAINAAGLLLLQVPLGLIIGLAAGMANMIPYMALVVGLAPALLLSWAEHQSWLNLIGVCGVFGGAQLLEGTLLSPKILGKRINLHPVWVLLAVIAGGSLFGFFGMLLSVPAAAVIQVFARHWVETYRNSSLYRDKPAASGKGGD